MATFTITTAVNIDTLASKAGNDTYNINGGYLTIDQHTRYGNNQNTSAAMGNTTLSATLGGTIEFNSTLVRCIAYNTGTGNVPALDTAITKGSASGKLLGVYSALNAAPTAAGAAMPASGYILIRQWNGVTYTTGALGGISASATAADRAGWLEIVGVDAKTVTVNRLNLFKVRGDYYDFQGANTDGTRATTYQIPTNGDTNMYLPGVEVETGTGTGVYEFYPCAGTQTALITTVATDALRGKWCWISTSGLLRFGHDGTNSTGGYIPPAGRKIRIPNIFFMCCTAAALTVNVIPNATLTTNALTTRYDFVTTGGGAIDIDKASINWNCSFNQPYSVALTNVFILNQLILTECASPIAWSNVGIGNEILTNGMVATPALTMRLNFAGGTISNPVWTRSVQAAGGTYATEWTDCNGFTITNEICRSLTKAGAANCGSMILTRASNMSWSNTLLGANKVSMTNCANIVFSNTVYYDTPANTTPSTPIMYAWDIASSSINITLDGLTFGGLALVQPYTGILNIQAAGCDNIKLRNLGTAASPLDMGGDYVNATWTRSTTTMTVTKTAHGLKTGDLIAVNACSDVAPKALTASTGTLWTVASTPTADTFTVTVTNAGQTSGQFLSYYPCMTGTVVSLAASAAASDIKVQRCYTPHLRTGIRTGDNSSKNITFESVWGTDWGVQLVPELNAIMRGIQATPTYAGQTSTYGTHFFDHYTTAVPTNTVSVSWTRSTTVATVTSTNHGLRVGDLINVITTSDAAAIVKGQKTLTQITASASPGNPADVFSFTCLNAGAASGTLTFVVLSGRVAVQMNEAATETSSQVALTGNAAFTSAGGLYMPTINMQADFTAPKNILGHSSFPIAQAVMAGGTIGNYDITYSLDGGSTYKNLNYSRAGGGGTTGQANVTMTDTTGVAVGDYVFGTNVAPNAKVSSITNSTTIVVDIVNIGTVSGVLTFNHLPSETVADPLVGFSLKLRVKTTTTNATAITSLYFFTNSTTAARAAQYPMDPVNVTVTAKDASTLTTISGARAYLVTDTGGPASPGIVVLNTTSNSSGVALASDYAFVSNQPVVGKIRKGTGSPMYKTAPLSGTITSAGLDLIAFMVPDE